MGKTVNVKGTSFEIPAFPTKPTKSNLVKYIMGYFKKNKELKKKYADDVAEYNKKINEVADKIKESPDLVSKVGGTGKGSGIGTKVKVGAGVAGGVGGAKVVSDVSEEMGKKPQFLNKGGIVAPQMGGKPTHKSKKSSKSIAKKYFKGTFQLVELTKAVKHILNKIDSEIESRKNAFADGKIIKENFEKSVGQVRGLVLAKEIVRETAKNIEELDD